MKVLEELSLDPRARGFEERSRIYWGYQYEHLEDWNNPDVQMRDKKPPVIHRMTKNAIDTLKGYLFGEGQIPSFKIKRQKDESEEKSKPKDDALADVFSRSNLEHKLQELARLGAQNGTVGLAFHYFDQYDRFDVEVLTLGDAEPTFGYQDRLTALENDIDFDDLVNLKEFWRSFQTIDGETVEFRHRRDWTLTHVVEYEPINLSEITLDERGYAGLKWSEDPALTNEHNLGFVPVEWIKFIPVTDDIDGAPLIDDAEFKIEDEFNYTLSQTGRGIHYQQEPKTVFKDCQNLTQESVSIGGPNTVAIDSKMNMPASVSLLEMTGNGAVLGMQYSNHLSKIFYQVSRIVLHNPEEYAGVTSGTALRMLLQPMIALVHEIRPNFGNPLARLLSKMVAAETGNVGKLDQVEASWPPVIQLNMTDLLLLVDVIDRLLMLQVITDETALEMVAPFFDIKDIPSYIELRKTLIVSEGTTQVEDGENT